MKNVNMTVGLTLTDATTVYSKEHVEKKLHLYECGHMGIIEGGFSTIFYPTGNCDKCIPVEMEWSKGIFSKLAEDMDKGILKLLDGGKNGPDKKSDKRGVDSKANQDAPESTTKR